MTKGSLGVAFDQALRGLSGIKTSRASEDSSLYIFLIHDAPVEEWLDGREGELNMRDDLVLLGATELAGAVVELLTEAGGGATLVEGIGAMPVELGTVAATLL